MTHTLSAESAAAPSMPARLPGGGSRYVDLAGAEPLAEVVPRRARDSPLERELLAPRSVLSVFRVEALGDCSGSPFVGNAGDGDRPAFRSLRQADDISTANMRGRLCALAVHLHFAAENGSRREAACLEEARSPEPLVDPDLVQWAGVVNATAGGLQQLTHMRERTSDPKWSPDGRWIAFTAGGAFFRSIYVVRSDGTAVKRLTRPGHNNVDPNWLSNTQLGYTNLDTSEWWSVNINKPSSKQRLREWIVGDVLWRQPLSGFPRVLSPDRRWVAFQTRRSIWAARRDGSHRRVVTRGVCRCYRYDIDWSPR